MGKQGRDDSELEQDERFPSGPWTGFFLDERLREKKLWMELDLTFRRGAMVGEGRDKVGTFLIRGKYLTESGKCWWSKRYVGLHDVAYQGFNEGKGIWGTWELSDLGPRASGGFHIWPQGLGGAGGPALSAKAETPTEIEAEGELVGAGTTTAIPLP